MLLVSCRSCSENRDVNKGQFHSLPTLLNKSLTLRSSIPLGAGEEILGLSKFGSHGTPQVDIVELFLMRILLPSAIIGIVICMLCHMKLGLRAI